MIIERFGEHRLEDWAIKMMANGLRDDLRPYVQKKMLPYFDAAMRLVAEHPDLFRRKGYSLLDVRFSQHVTNGTKVKKLVSCVADFCGGPTPTDEQIENFEKRT